MFAKNGTRHERKKEKEGKDAGLGYQDRLERKKQARKNAPQLPYPGKERKNISYLPALSQPLRKKTFFHAASVRVKGVFLHQASCSFRKPRSQKKEFSWPPFAREGTIEQKLAFLAVRRRELGKKRNEQARLKEDPFLFHPSRFFFCESGQNERSLSLFFAKCGPQAKNWHTKQNLKTCPACVY